MFPYACVICRPLQFHSKNCGTFASFGGSGSLSDPSARYSFVYFQVRCGSQCEKLGLDWLWWAFLFDRTLVLITLREYGSLRCETLDCFEVVVSYVIGSCNSSMQRIGVHDFVKSKMVDDTDRSTAH